MIDSSGGERVENPDAWGKDRGGAWSMERKGFVAKAWRNSRKSKTGAAGYGLKVEIPDRDLFFDRSWKTVRLNLVGPVNDHMAEVNVDKSSFWSCICRELISKDIGRWFIDNGLVQWPKGRPPRFWVAPTNECEFKVKPYN